MNYKEALENATYVAKLVERGLNPCDILIFGSTARKQKQINDLDLFLVVEEIGEFSRFSNQYPDNWPDNFREGWEKDPFLSFFLSFDKSRKLLVEDKLPCGVDFIFLPREVITSHRAWKNFNDGQPDKHFLNKAFKHLLRWKNGLWVPVKRRELVKEYLNR